jgi:hypothetical protein
MSLKLKRWRAWMSPAARQGRKAATTHAEWVAKQRQQYADAAAASSSRS